MSLRAFHILFITVSALCCVSLLAWSVERHRAGDAQAWWLGAIAATGVGALVVYLRWFLKTLRRP